MPVKCKGPMKIYGHTNAVIFEVDTKVGPVYMSINETTGMESRSACVVDSETFLGLWRANPYPLHKDIANCTLTDWRNDRKIHHAEKGFSHGIINPVPLAEVSYEGKDAISGFRSALFNGKS